MGLDNGIQFKILDREKFGDIPKWFKRESWEDQHNFDYEVLYWRKCWNVRHIILDVLGEGSDDGYEFDITREELVEIIHRLEDDLHYFDFLEGEWGSCIWEWNEFRYIRKRNIKNLKKLAKMMKRYPEIEVIFYES